MSYWRQEHDQENKSARSLLTIAYLHPPWSLPIIKIFHDPIPFISTKMMNEITSTIRWKLRKKCWSWCLLDEPEIINVTLWQHDFIKNDKALGTLWTKWWQLLYWILDKQILSNLRNVLNKTNVLNYNKQKIRALNKNKIALINSILCFDKTLLGIDKQLWFKSIIYPDTFNIRLLFLDNYGNCSIFSNYILLIFFGT